MTMADQDENASHMKRLLINFADHNWPPLISNIFMEEFIKFVTPIAKVTKGEKEKAFFSHPEDEKWKLQANNWHTWKINQGKRSSTSTAKEAKEHFSDVGRYCNRFRYDGYGDGKALGLAFSKKKIDDLRID
ncbi:hypothetical protein D918_09756 [Trichuris suis]|nr:hypothetical protein D918_09756 [Trichuris suis]